MRVTSSSVELQARQARDVEHLLAVDHRRSMMESRGLAASGARAAAARAAA